MCLNCYSMGSFGGLAKTDFKKFLQLAEYYYGKDKEFYDCVFQPILDQVEKNKTCYQVNQGLDKNIKQIILYLQIPIINKEIINEQYNA